MPAGLSGANIRRRYRQSGDDGGATRRTLVLLPPGFNHHAVRTSDKGGARVDGGKDLSQALLKGLDRTLRHVIPAKTGIRNTPVSLLRHLRGKNAGGTAADAGSTAILPPLYAPDS
ncbi:MAG: hypothetical protein ACUVTZ_11800 [Armatimonadota bacterium]